MRVIVPGFRWLSGKAPDGRKILDIITTAGRIAYQSQKIGNEEAFVRMLISRGHESVLEHCSVGVVLTCDRGITHETVRHRIAAYTQESTRYCNYSGDKFGNEITCIDISGGIENDASMSSLSDDQLNRIYSEWWAACEDSERHYLNMIDAGASPQIARSVLNNSLKTEIAITYNMREWRHFFKLRTAKDAHPQMREAAGMLLDAFKKEIPVIFEDIEYEQSNKSLV